MTHCKNQLKVTDKQMSKWQDFLKIGENLCDFGLEKDFLDTSKGPLIKEKTGNWIWSPPKKKNLLEKNTRKRIKREEIDKDKISSHISNKELVSRIYKKKLSQQKENNNSI